MLYPRLAPIIREGFWPFIVTLALSLRMVFEPEQIEAGYSRGVFLYIRQTQDLFSGIAPFPLIYLLLLFLLLITLRNWWRIWRRDQSFWKRLGYTAWSLAKGMAALTFFFTVLWGYNYGRVSLEAQTGLQPEPLPLAELIEELEETTCYLEDYRRLIPGASDVALGEADLPEDVEYRGRRGLEQLLETLDYPTTGTVRARQLKPRGILLRFNSSGVYLPWTGEGHVDDGLHPLQKPFVMIHEMAHGYGFTDEGTCNFLGVLGGLQCRSPFIRYSVLLGYWRYLASDVRFHRRDQYEQLYQQLSPGIRADLRAIYEYQNAYPEIFPQLRYIAYDTYLKAQGIEEGILNYDRILVLMKAWKDRSEQAVF